MLGKLMLFFRNTLMHWFMSVRTTFIFVTHPSNMPSLSVVSGERYNAHITTSTCFRWTMIVLQMAFKYGRSRNTVTSSGMNIATPPWLLSFLSMQNIVYIGICISASYMSVDRWVSVSAIHKAWLHSDSSPSYAILLLLFFSKRPLKFVNRIGVDYSVSVVAILDPLFVVILCAGVPGLISFVATITAALSVVWY